MQQVNLLQEESTAGDAWGLRRLIQVLVLVMVAMALWSLGHWWWMERVELEVTQLRQQREQALARLGNGERSEVGPEVQALREQVARLESERDRRRQVVERLRRGGFGNLTGFSSYLAGLASEDVQGLWLTQVHLSQGGQQMALEGRAWSADRVPELLRVLSEDAAFRGIEFRQVQVSLDEAGGGPIKYRLASQVSPEIRSEPR